MSIPFASGNNITQNYGERPEYYAQFKLAGHEGIDIVPVNATDLDVQCVEDGIVVKDLDDPKSGSYGIYVVVWNRANQRAWWYCHLSENYATLNQNFKRGDLIGKMGDTGNTQGPHLHLGMTLTDVNGARLNNNNGYFGFVDPMPAFNQLNAAPSASASTPTTPAAPAPVNFAKVTWAMEQAARILQGEGLLPEYQYILDNYLADAIKRRDRPQ